MQAAASTSPTPTTAEPGPDVGDEELLRALDGAVASGRVPGVSAVVVAGGAVAWSGASGSADARTGTPLVPDTSLLWFSMTKILTATVTMQLVDDGRLTLETLVEDLVPGVLPERGRRVITVHHLLAHSSGIPNPPPIRWVRPASTPALDPAAFLRARFARVRRLRFEPGTRSRYTNLGYLLLGEVVAAAAAQPFVDVATDRVLAPLRMDSTSFEMPPHGRRVAATGHQRLVRGAGPLLKAALPRGIVASRTGPWIRFRPFLVDGAPYGGLVGPVTDAARLVAAHARGGELDGVRVLPEQATLEMQQVVSSGRPFDHGLGWFRPPKDARRVPSFVEHYGGGGGYHNLMRLYPAAGVGVVVMGNSTSYDVDVVVDEIARPFLDVS
jgi:CubicO group peptidase (beta-lactamase class C family)